MPPSRKGKKKSQGRVYLALGLAALAVIGYLWFRSRSSASLAASPSGAAAGSAGLPAGGGASGSGTGSTDSGLASILGALQGENQSLLDAFVKSEQGFLSLVGSSVGAPAPQTQVVEPAGSPTPAAAPAPAPAAAAPAPAPAPVAASPFVASVSDLAPQVPAPADLQQPLGPVTSIVDYNPGVPVEQTGGSIDEAAATIAGIYADATPQPAPSPPVYGITYGPPAGERGSANPKQGVYSVH